MGSRVDNNLNPLNLKYKIIAGKFLFTEPSDKFVYKIKYILMTIYDF